MYQTFNMKTNEERKKIADKILYEKGLWNKLNEFGTPHIIGSYKMNMMAWNDLDIDIENDKMSMDKLYDLTQFIISTFHPKWYEAKEEITNEGKIVWFHGFEAIIDEELWNFDLWFFDAETILKSEKYCDEIIRKVQAKPGSQEIIIKIKQELQEQKLYSFDKYTSMDVYRGVLELGIQNTNEFLELYKKD